MAISSIQIQALTTDKGKKRQRMTQKFKSRLALSQMSPKRNVFIFFLNVTLAYYWRVSDYC